MADAIDKLLATIDLPGPWQRRPLPAGPLNRSWHLQSGQRQLMVKKLRGNDLFDLDRDTEVALQKQLHHARLAPEVIAFDRDENLLIQQWIDGDSLAQVDWSMERKLELLVQAMVRVHNVSPRVPHWSLHQRLIHYCAALERFSPKQAAAYADRIEHFQQLLADWEQQPACFCHNDLSFNHVLLADSPIIIDWEYAGYGHPWLDLANAAEINQLNGEEVKLLCKFYQQASGNPVTSGDIAPWRALVDTMNDLWFAVQRAQRGTH